MILRVEINLKYIIMFAFVHLEINHNFMGKFMKSMLRILYFLF